MKAFTAAVLGGIGNIPGAMVGGMMLGLLEAFAASYLSIFTTARSEPSIKTSSLFWSDPDLDLSTEGSARREGTGE